MKNGWVQACFVGCDRIAANGDFANKIGTSGVAILAKHYGIPVYTLGPTSTIDMNCPDGEHIPIELRDGEEIKNLWYEKPMALPEVKCFNPAFDVTDHELLTGIVTEKGICYPPFTESLAALFKDQKRNIFTQYYKEDLKMAIQESPSACIAAEENSIAKAVLMPGDPLRAKFVAEHYLENPVCFNTVRNMLGYTGTYKGRKLSVMGHGMGVPSAGLYAHELYNFYGVDTIIRIGSAGGIGEDVKRAGRGAGAWGLPPTPTLPTSTAFPDSCAPRRTTALLKERRRRRRRSWASGRTWGRCLPADQFYNDNRGGQRNLPEIRHSGGGDGNRGNLLDGAALRQAGAVHSHHLRPYLHRRGPLSPQERQDSFHEMMEIALETAWKAAE